MMKEMWRVSRNKEREIWLLFFRVDTTQKAIRPPRGNPSKCGEDRPKLGRGVMGALASVLVFVLVPAAVPEVELVEEP